MHDEEELRGRRRRIQRGIPPPLLRLLQHSTHRTRTQQAALGGWVASMRRKGPTLSGSSSRCPGGCASMMARATPRVKQTKRQRATKGGGDAHLDPLFALRLCSTLELVCPLKPCVLLKYVPILRPHNSAAWR